jgi:hypothetical protein
MCGQSFTLFGMATVVELARHAGVSVDLVVRVLSGEPVSAQASDRVEQAIEDLGRPGRPARSGELVPQSHEELNEVRLLERFTEAASRAVASDLPEGVGSVVYEALRVEVRPVADTVAQLATLFDGLLQRLDQLTAEVEVQRRERLEDVELLTELATSGWRNVDRRLGRLEKMVERQQAPASNSSPVARFPDRRPTAVKE